jgi:mannose-1-phosphate guanylyltransferase
LGKGVFPVKSFIEKPNINKAKMMYRRKDIYWNAGIFCWKANVFFEELKKYLPGLYNQIIKVHSKHDINKIWSKIKPISIDYGLLEKSKKIVLVPAGFSWTDLGSWDALYEILPKDKNNSVIQADYFGLDSKNNIILSKSKRLIASVGIKNLVIIDTPDALLICDRDKSQEIKTLFDCLKKEKRKECIKMPSL